MTTAITGAYAYNRQFPDRYADIPDYEKANGLVVLLPGAEADEIADVLVAAIDPSLRRTIRMGLSGLLPLAKLTEAVDNARLAASVAECGRPPLEFSAMAGSARMDAGVLSRLLPP